MIYDAKIAGTFICPIMPLKQAPAPEKKMSDSVSRAIVYGYCIGTGCALFRHVEPFNEENPEGYCGLGGNPFVGGTGHPALRNQK